MLLLTPTLVLLIFGAIIIISIIIAWWLGRYTTYEKSRFHIFIAVFTGLGVIIVFAFYWNLVNLQGQQQELAVVQELSRINNSVINTILNEISDAATTIPNFVLSITPLSNTVCGENCKIVGEDKENPINCTQKMVLAYKIFSAWQDVISSNRLISFDATSYIANFLQRANSKQLYLQWLASRLDFSKSTEQLGDLLFEYGLPITVQTPETYVKTSELLIADPRYKNILES